jgi:hypothetical protein
MLTIKKRPYLPFEKEMMTGESPPGTEGLIFRPILSRRKELLSWLGNIFFLLIFFVLSDIEKI